MSSRRIQRPQRPEDDRPDPQRAPELDDIQADDALVMGGGEVPDRLEDRPKDLLRPDLLTDRYSQQKAEEALVEPEIKMPAQFIPAPEIIEPDTGVDEHDVYTPTYEEPAVISSPEEEPVSYQQDRGDKSRPIGDFLKSFEEDDPQDEWNDPPDLFSPTVTPEAEGSLVHQVPEELDDEDEDEIQLVSLEEPEAKEEQTVCVATQGFFAGPPVLSLISPNLTQEVDELNDAFSAFSTLKEGQTGFIRVAFRTDDQFRGYSSQYVHALKYGQDPEPEVSRGSRVWGIIKFLIAFLVHQVNGGEGAAPRSPFAGPPSDLRPVSSVDQTAETKQLIRDAENKSLSKVHYETRLIVGIVGKEHERESMEMVCREVQAGFDAYSTPFQRLAWEEVDGYEAVSGFMAPDPDRRLILSAEELGELARIPDDLTNPIGVRVNRALVKPLLPHLRIPLKNEMKPPKGVIPIATIAKDTEDEQTIGLRNRELDKHMFITGRTGTGKSVFMQWIMYGVAKSGYPIVVVDPHGALADDVLDMLIKYCPERKKDIVLVDFTERDWPIQLNPLDIQNRDQIEAVVHSVMEMLSFQMRLDGSSAPRAVNYAQQAITALTEANLHLPNPEIKCTLLQVTTFFTDPQFRHLVLNLSSNPSIREAYDPQTGPFEQLSDKQQTEHVMPILRAFQPLGNSASFSNVFASGENRMDFTRLINGNKIVLMKLAKHANQKALASFVGSLIIPYMLQSMDDWGRVKDPETGQFKGRGVRLFIDEAHTICGGESSVINVLAEARKWDFGVIAATQFPQQLDKSVEQAFYANTATKVTFALDPGAVGSIDKSIDGGTGLINRGDIINLPNYYAYFNLLLSDDNGQSMQSGPFSGMTLPPLPVDRREKEHKEMLQEVKDQSRLLVCQNLRDVEKKRMDFMQTLKANLVKVIQEQVNDEPDGEEWVKPDNSYSPSPYNSGEKVSGSEEFPWT